MSIAPLIMDIEPMTIDNEDYRRVMFTGKYIQTVLMSLLPGEDIPEETHDGDQFIRIEEGYAFIMLNGETFNIKSGQSIDIPAGTKHYIKNIGNSSLKLYTNYSPPEHSDGLVQNRQPNRRKLY